MSCNNNSGVLFNYMLQILKLLFEDWSNPKLFSPPGHEIVLIVKAHKRKNTIDSGIFETV